MLFENATAQGRFVFVVAFASPDHGGFVLTIWIYDKGMIRSTSNGDDQIALFTGGCLCGAVRFSCHEPPLLVSYCHCRMCQKQTGAPFSVMANFSRNTLKWSGTERKLRRSSPLAVRGFCGDCGSPLSFEYSDSDHTSVAVGALDHPGRVRPTQHGGMESKIAWVTIDEHLPTEQVDDDPDYRALLQQTGWKPPRWD
jgi:hypothetical protein